MALTFTNMSTPNQKVAEFSLGPWKARIITVTLDASYLTTGEVLTAKQLGWNAVIGAVPLTGGFANAAGTLSHTAIVRPNAAQTQLAFQAQESAGTVDTPHKEATSGADLSAYSGSFIVIGL